MDVPLAGSKCASAGGAVLGGGSSLAFTGGGARGTILVQGRLTQESCTFPGGSGGCADVRLGAGTGCQEARAGGVGYINEPALPGVPSLPTLTSPVVAASSRPCDILLATATSPHEVEAFLEQAMLEQMDAQLIAILPTIALAVPEPLRAEFLSQAEQVRTDWAAFIAGISVDEAYEVHYPADVARELVVTAPAMA